MIENIEFPVKTSIWNGEFSVVSNGLVMILHQVWFLRSLGVQEEGVGGRKEE